MKFKRYLSEKLLSVLKSRRSVLLFGPRQTGKTTLIQELCSHFNSVLEYPLQLPSVRARLESDPEFLKREVEALKSSAPPLIFIDEIQKVPALMDVLQRLLDEKKAVLIATGSSARKMRKQRANWLPGRVIMERLHPLSWKESGLVGKEGFDLKLLEETLLFGALPGILSQEKSARAEILDSYAALYLEEEIRQEAAVRRLPPFSRFLRLAALESGTSPNASKIAADIGVSHTSVREYYQILEDSLVTHRLEAFGRSRSDVLRKPKYYFFDMGVRNAAAGIGHDRGLLTLQMGTLFEHLVILEALALASHLRLSYWRTKNGKETDLVIERPRRLIAVEIKATTKPRESDFAGLYAFRQSEKCDAAYLVCRVDRPQKFAQGLALPWQRFTEIVLGS